MRHALLPLLPAAAGLLLLLGGANLGCGRKSPVEPTPPCSFTIVPASQDFLDVGGNGSVAVSAPAGCDWTATASQAWITVSSGGTGSGNGTVVYAVAQNAAPDPRAGMVTIAGQTHAVSQRGRTVTVECRLDLSPTSASFGKDAAEGTFAVRVVDGCEWAATSHADWLTVVGSGRGSGTGSVRYAVSRNRESEPRSATITVADRTFTVRQSGDSGVCEYSVTPVELSICMPGGQLTALVTTQAGCTWSATSDVSWVGVQSGANGVGSGSITLAVADNYDAPRAARVLVRWPTPTLGQNIQLAQAGCRYAVSRTTLTFTATGGIGSFDVLQQSDPLTCGGATQNRCVWSAVPSASWISVTGTMPRAGDDTVTVSVSANTDAEPRTATIAIRDKLVTVTQAGRP
jgi:hypothetical protein